MATLNGTGFPVESITRNGKFEPFDLQVGRGMISNHQLVQIFGYSTLVGSTALGPLWEGLTLSGGAYTYPPSAGVVVLLSSSGASDAGLVIQVDGLDSNYNLLSEVVTLNASGTATTSASFFRINALYSSNGLNVGNITAKIATVLYAQINAGIGQTQMSLYSVPNGYSLYLSYVQANASIGFTSSNYMLYAEYNKLNASPALPVASAAFGVNGYNPYVGTNSTTLSNQSPFVQTFQIPYQSPLLHVSATDIQLQLKANTGSPYTASVFAGGYLIKNDASV